jgi:hypothetical protein
MSGMSLDEALRVETGEQTAQDALNVLVPIVERAVEWYRDVDILRYRSETEQFIRDALHEILYGPDGGA